LQIRRGIKTWWDLARTAGGWALLGLVGGLLSSRPIEAVQMAVLGAIVGTVVIWLGSDFRGGPVNAGRILDGFRRLNP
jgi:hypothetical protein